MNMNRCELLGKFFPTMKPLAEKTAEKTEE